ncbi:sensor histidine kinase [Myxococcus stipitatus DSM 14675]|uniref:histidine kinase n=1 Tax=Myxococcus stipitatus (strain DSM 14675 / JCM 12634 / Mx s8) TaxID=1278073 RepID=L7U8I8_MYXSD|nr:histidine kinase dimerization/phospho-acceptor domain-containing protein [Myxococcus stipitatus]AGC44403.1 sensor histidine kinase [Myxococcus stipitatus DSM 14675]
MPIPLRVQAGAWSGWGVDLGFDAGIEQALAAVAERALRCGALAGMELLLRETLRLTSASGAALFDGSTCVARVGTHAAGFPSSTGRRLRLWPERTGPRDDALLERLSALGGALLAAHAREASSQARHARLLSARRRLEQEVAHWEVRRSLAAHDLRTPLMVVRGYVDMMLKGHAGPLCSTMQRYLDRMARATQDQRAVIDQRLGRNPITDLGPLLQTALGPHAKQSPRRELTLALPERPMRVRASTAQLEAWVRVLARALATTRSTSVWLLGVAVEATRCWQLDLRMQGGHAPAERPLAVVREHTRRLGGTLRAPSSDARSWIILLPAEAT